MPPRLDLKPLPGVTPQVSDHAVVRWLERRLGLDMDVVRAEILTEDRAAAIRAGARRIKLRAIGLELRINDTGVVTTVLRTGSPEEA